MAQVTQHIYPAMDSKGTPVSIVVGWDQANQEFYGKVFRRTANGNYDDTPVVSIIIHDHGGDELDTLLVSRWLELIGCSIPQQVFEALDDDEGAEVPDTEVKFYDEFGSRVASRL